MLHIAVELGKAVGQVQGVLVSLLEQLIKYSGVWVHYPTDHLTKHRLSHHLAALTELTHDFSLTKYVIGVMKCKVPFL